jgi:Ser/Thr protein kinase RdoA (MazF antagonist)
VKILPDNPNLDHLRQQAKDLLAGLRDVRPDATLADAQTSLADQYGFRTWADLKAEVDRCRDGAAVADPELVRQIAARFDLGEVTGDMRSLSRPDESGRRWLLETDRGRWLPRTVDNVYPRSDGADNARFQEAAARAGVVLPAPVRSTGGRVTEEIGGNRWRVHAGVRSGPPFAAPVSAAVTAEVGSVLATLHDLAFPADRICPWNTTRFAARTWPETVDLAAAKGVAWLPELTAALPVLDGLAAIDDEPTAGAVMCHNDFSTENVRLGAAGQLVVSGWEHADGLPPAWELCAALVEWAVDPAGEVSEASVRALLNGYGTVPELTLGCFRGIATGLLNYVSGEICLALEASGAEDARFADRNVRHLLTHLPSRETFERVLETANKNL